MQCVCVSVCVRVHACTGTCVLVHRDLYEEKQTLNLETWSGRCWSLLSKDCRPSFPPLYVKLFVCGMIMLLEGARCSVHQHLIGVLENVSL